MEKIETLNLKIGVSYFSTLGVLQVVRAERRWSPTLRTQRTTMQTIQCLRHRIVSLTFQRNVIYSYPPLYVSRSKLLNTHPICVLPTPLLIAKKNPEYHLIPTKISKKMPLESRHFQCLNWFSTPLLTTVKIPEHHVTPLK